MGRRKTPETQEEWRQEISHQLLALARSRKISPTALRPRFEAVRALAKLHGITIEWKEVDAPTQEEVSAAIEANKHLGAPGITEVIKKPEPPAPAPAPAGGSILDEMGDH